jgi:hypothetical protein
MAFCFFSESLWLSNCAKLANLIRNLPPEAQLPSWAWHCQLSCARPSATTGRARGQVRSLRVVLVPLTIGLAHEGLA